MNISKTYGGLLFFNAAYLLFFGYHYVAAVNYEFIAYLGLIIGIIIAMMLTLKHTQFPTYILVGLSLWGLMHMMGGSVSTPDGVLYAWKIYPFFDGGGEFYVLKFDQVVHGFLYAVVALMFMHLLEFYYELKKTPWLVATIAIMASLGVSSINEIIEFTAVVMLPETGVGGYYNTMLDIVFNFAGAVFAVGGLLLWRKFTSN